MRESKIEEAVIKFAVERGWLQRKVTYVGRRGSPDRWFFGPGGGRLIIVEFKRPGEAPEPHQKREIARLRKRGFEVHVIDNVADGYALFEEAD